VKIRQLVVYNVSLEKRSLCNSTNLDALGWKYAVKSELTTPHVNVLPPIVAPKLKICAAVPRATGALTNAFPQTPVMVTKAMRTGIQAQFAYLQKVRERLGLLSHTRETMRTN